MNYLNVFNYDDNQSTFYQYAEIGVVAIAIAFILEMSGIMLFFNRKCLLLANVLLQIIQLAFLFGIYLFRGAKGLITFFAQKGRFKASLVYFLGFIIIIVLHQGFIGTIVQGTGLFIICKGYLATIYGWVCRIPYIGKYLSIFSMLFRKLQNSKLTR